MTAAAEWSQGSLLGTSILFINIFIRPLNNVNMALVKISFNEKLNINLGFYRHPILYCLLPSYTTPIMRHLFKICFVQLDCCQGDPHIKK